jgi:hypothetical protein
VLCRRREAVAARRAEELLMEVQAETKCKQEKVAKKKAKKNAKSAKKKEVRQLSECLLSEVCFSLNVCMYACLLLTEWMHVCCLLLDHASGHVYGYSMEMSLVCCTGDTRWP